ncbi:MAG: SAM-dependent chlorinase/fluorinase [Candidatus Bathyarchaeota archaeon]|nr:MAG: SAM-dependent chlorinase/fluorinase [Candidatus Bathyarchaeota archaeon]
MPQKIVTLLSDFGLRDPYVAEMKAVILSKCPEAKIVDISHEIAKFDVYMGAFVLACAAPHFPKGTVHVAVVDPGVGTRRRSIIVETKLGYYVGPDNGILMQAGCRESLDHVYAIENPQFVAPKVSKTFHGRDIFASVAAYLAEGVRARAFGTEIKDYVVPDFAKPSLADGSVFGQVMHVDGFGNVITNIPSEIVKNLGIREQEVLKVEIGKKDMVLTFCSAYGDVADGVALAIIGSHEFLELSVNRGSAEVRFKAKIGDSIRVQRQNYI